MCDVFGEHLAVVAPAAQQVHEYGAPFFRSLVAFYSPENLRLGEALAGHRGHDICFIDCPPSLSLLTVNALVAAQRVLIPMQCEYYALEGLSQLLSTIDLVRDNLNPRLRLAGVLLTMYDQRLNLSRQVADEAKEYFGSRVFKSVIPRNVRLAEAPSFGKPIVLYDILSAGAQSYLSLAREVMDRSTRGPGDGAFSVSQFGVGGIWDPVQAIQGVSVNGGFEFGDNPPADFIRNNITVADDYSWVNGRHEWHFGGTIEFSRVDLRNYFFSPGRFNFESMDAFLEGRLSGYGSGDASRGTPRTA